MLEAIAGFYAAAFVVPVVVLGFAVAYISLRIRDSRSETPDPELGIKSAYHAFMTAGILLILTGLTISATDFLNEAFEDKQKNAQPQFGPQGPFGPQPQFRPQPRIEEEPFERLSQRVAWPLVISGTLFGLISLLLIVAGTNDRQFPAVKRTFGGLRLVVEGLCVMAGITITIELLFQKDLVDMRPFSIAIALFGIWLPAAAIQVFLLKMYGRLPYYVPPMPKKGEAPRTRRGRGRRRQRRAGRTPTPPPAPTTARGERRRVRTQHKGTARQSRRRMKRHWNADEMKSGLETQVIGVQCKESGAVPGRSYGRIGRKWNARLFRGGRNAIHFLCVDVCETRWLIMSDELAGGSCITCSRRLQGGKSFAAFGKHAGQ